MRKVLAVAIAFSIVALGGCSKKSTSPSSDTTNPVVVFVQPLNNATVGVGTVVIQVTATDNVGVTKVTFYDGTTKIGELTAATSGSRYDMNWTSTAGTHTLRAVASDAASNTAEQSITVNAVSDSVDPTVSFVYPLNNAMLGLGTITLQAAATDNIGVTKVAFFDGATKIGEVTTTTAGTYNMSWTPVVGEHSVKATAYDAANNTADAIITVTITGGPTLHSGHITQSETWYPAGNPHRITGDVDVSDPSNSPTLTIMPGCIVQFNSGTELYCGYYNAGAIVAEGKADSLITFTSTSTTPGDYVGISAYSHSTPATSFKYCTIEYGGSSSQGELFANDASIKITNCTVRYSQYSGIKFQGDNSNPRQFSNNTITNCGAHAIEIAPDFIRLLGTGNTIAANTNNDIFVYYGAVKNTGTWQNYGVPYLLTQDVFVEDATNSPVLTIAPGCTLKLGSGVEFYCGYNQHGTIIAEGKADSVITFTSNSNPPSPGDWKAVEIYSNSGSGVSFNYCRFEYGGSGNDDGALHIENATAKVNNSTIAYSGHHGVKLQGTGTFTQFTGNTISNCLGHAIVLEPEYIKSLGLTTITANTNNDIFVLYGTVKTSGTWLNHGVPYTLSADVAIQDASNSPVVTIAPGTTIRLQAGAELYAGYNYPGGLIADGTAGQITFTSAVGSPSPGDWQAISFYDKAMDASSKLKNCVIEYGGGLNANVYIDNSNPEITGCTITHSSQWGIYLSGSTHPDKATLEGANTFSNNTDGNVGP